MKLLSVFLISILIDKNMLTVSKLDSTLKEPLTCLINSSLNVSWENNNSYQLTFTAYSDNSVSYALLLSENIITWRDQQFVIKQIVPSYSSRYSTVSVTATHIYLDVRRIFKHDKKAGTLTYSVNDVLAFYIDKNSFGYSYEVKGNFSKEQITDLGGNNAFEGLSQIITTWPEAVIYPDNKKIIVYSKDSFAKNFGNRIGYGHNSDNMTLTYDSTNIINQLTVISATKDDNSVYFQPHIIKDDDSIKDYGIWDGGDFTDERFHDVKAADDAAKSRLAPQPSISIAIEYEDDDEPIPGEVRRLEILETGFVTDVMLVAYNYYPLDKNQKTSLTLNSNSKTVLDFQKSSKNQLNKTRQKTTALSRAIQEVSSQIKEIINNQPKSWVVGKVKK